MQASLLFSVQKLLLVSFPICLIVLYAVQRLFLRTSRQLRLMELESKSAVSSAILEAVDGLDTIRAFSWQSQIKSRFTAALDQSQKPVYLMLCLQRWLNLVLDLMAAGMAISVLTTAIILPGNMTGGDMGVALNIVVIVNFTLLKMVDAWSALELSLGGVVRLKALISEVPREENDSELDLMDTWQPSRGGIELRNLTASYRYMNLTFVVVLAG